MSTSSLQILPRLTSFWPESEDRDPNFPNRLTLTRVDSPPINETVTRGGITIPPVEVEARFYRYVKGTATNNRGKTYEYTHRFISDPAADDAVQAAESAECKAVVQAELDRWLASAQAK